MYYNSTSTMIGQPTVSAYPAYDIRKTIVYIMDGISQYCSKERIKGSYPGYNDDEKKQIEILYLMAYKSVDSLSKKYVRANAALDDIASLENNWNDNGALKFSPKLIEKTRGIVSQLVEEPFICPTGCGSIQLEYEKDNGDYLEFEIFDDRIEIYMETVSEGEKEFSLQGISSTDKIKQMVVDFYG